MDLKDLSDNKGFSSSFIDYREDHPLKLLRILNIVDKLAYNRNGKPVLTVEKAAFINYLYENQAIIPCVFDYFGKDYSWMSLNPTLYDISIDTADLYIETDFNKNIIELVNKDLIKIEVISESYFISLKIRNTYSIDDDLQKSWDLLSNKLRFLLAKPTSTLYKSLPGYIK